MKFMLNGAVTLGTMDGANVEIVEEVGAENAFIFGLTSEEVMNFEAHGGYSPREIYNNDGEVQRIMNQMVDGTYTNGDTEVFRKLFNSLLDKDVYFILKDFRAYSDASERVNELYRKDLKAFTRMEMLNVAASGKFSSDRTIEEYITDIWHLEKVYLNK